MHSKITSKWLQYNQIQLYLAWHYSPQSCLTHLDWLHCTACRKINKETLQMQNFHKKKWSLLMKSLHQHKQLLRLFWPWILVSVDNGQWCISVRNNECLNPRNFISFHGGWTFGSCALRVLLTLVTHIHILLIN